MAEKADLEKAYLSGYGDGYNRAMPTRREIDGMFEQVRKENRADAEALRAKMEAAQAEVARLLEIKGAADSERDPEARLN